MKYISINDKTPNERFQCVILMWDVFTNNYEKGIGIYHKDTDDWETSSLSGYAAKVSFWYKIEDVPERLRAVATPDLYDAIYTS